MSAPYQFIIIVKIVLDLANWIDIPPPEFTISTLPDPVVLRQGEQKDIGIQLKSSSGITTMAVGFTPAENYSNIKVELNPDRVNRFLLRGNLAHLHLLES